MIANKLKPVAYRAWFDEDNGARWLFTLWPEEHGGEELPWQPLVTIESANQAVAEARRAALEDAAKACESLVTNEWDRSGSEDGSFNVGCEQCAITIRGLMDK